MIGFRLIITLVFFLAMLAAGVFQPEIVLWPAGFAPHVDVLPSQSLSAGSKVNSEVIAAVLSWHKGGPTLDRPPMNVVRARLRRSVVGGTPLSGADLDDPRDRTPLSEILRDCKDSTRKNSSMEICFDGHPVRIGEFLGHLLDYLDQAQREDAGDTMSVQVIKHMLDMYASQYGFRMAEINQSAAEAFRLEPPSSPPKPAIRVSRASVVFDWGATALSTSASMGLRDQVAAFGGERNCDVLALGHLDKRRSDNSIRLAYRRATELESELERLGFEEERVEATIEVGVRKGVQPQSTEMERKVDVYFVCGLPKGRGMW